MTIDILISLPKQDGEIIQISPASGYLFTFHLLLFVALIETKPQYKFPRAYDCVDIV